MVGFPFSSRWTFLGCYHGCHQRNTHGHHGFGNLHGFGHQLGGTDTATLTIEVNDVAPSSIAYSPNSFTLTKDTAMTTTTPTSSGGAVVTWSVSPTLPAGLSLDASTGALSGTPTAVTASATYTITATNTGGTDTTTVTIEVNDVVPSSILYSPNSFTLTKGTAMTTVTPTTSGGSVTLWSVSPSLPPVFVPVTV